MEIVDRAVLVVKPKQPYLDWVNGLEDAFDGVTLEHLRHDAGAYLVPSFADDDHAEAIVRDCYEEIFFEELWAWNEDESQFPPGRTYEMFKEWFDVELCSLVRDLLVEPVTKEAE